MKKINVLSLFSGIGGFEKALHDLEVDYHLVNYSEIDIFASKSYSIIHNVDEKLNLGDISKIDEKQLPKDIDLIFYGFPCTNISRAGKKNGFFNEDGSKTKSGLVFDALRIINEVKPKVAMLENVMSLLGDKFKSQFEELLYQLELSGYNNFYNILDSRCFKIPQKRERVFVVSIRNDITLNNFNFPQGEPLEIDLDEFLDFELEVDDKYYLTDEQIYSINNSKFSQRRGVLQEKYYCDTLLARDYKDPKCIRVGNKIRRLTPNEYLKLMGFENINFDKLNNAISDSQLYKQCGNSVSVPVVKAILQSLIDCNIFN